jgi:hypothetical protein
MRTVPHSSQHAQGGLRAAFSLAVLTTAMALAGCGLVQPARMALPQALGEPQAIEGLGGTREGRFRIGATQGEFKRSATRLSLFSDAFARDGASATFSLPLSSGTGTLQGRCDMRRTSAHAGVLRFEPQPLAYICNYSATGMPGSMVLREARPSAQIGPAPREGEITLGGVTLTVQASYRVQGSALPLAQPSGYLFSQRGETLAAVDLTDSTRPVVHLRREAPEPLRDAVMAASLSLALLWDPAP